MTPFLMRLLAAASLLRGRLPGDPPSWHGLARRLRDEADAIETPAMPRHWIGKSC